MRRLIIFTLMLLTLKPILAKERNPVADPQSVVTFGKARFTILTSSLVRMEWSSSKQFEDKASFTFVNRKLLVPQFTAKQNSKKLVVTTKDFRLEYTDDGKPFSTENLLVTFTLEGQKKSWKPGQKDDKNLKGTTRTVDQAHEVTPEMLEDGIISRSGWALIDDSKRLLFDGVQPKEWFTERADSNAIDYYLFVYGHRYKEAVSDYMKIAGNIPMPPKFAFGYWYSRYFCYSDQEIYGIIDDLKRYDVPTDVFIVDMDWHNTYGISASKNNMVGWTGYTWNKTLFPAPETFLKRIHSNNLKVALNLHPADGIYQKEDCFAPFAKAINADTAGVIRFPFKMEDKAWTDAYFSTVIRPLEQQGVDFWWLDWQQWPYSKGAPKLNNTWWLNYNFFTDMELNNDDRPLLFHRWGGMGNHRYQIGFSGDSHSTFHMLSTLPYFTATASNVGYGYWSHDIGGHMQRIPQTDPELYLRWIQYGVFSPILRTHSSKEGNIERRIWKFPNFNLMNDALHLRYELAPYIYTSAREAYDNGISICRPLYYEHPESEEAYQLKGEYYFGSSILVNPIATASDTNGIANQSTWIPDGEWYDMTTGKLIKGKTMVSMGYTNAEIPWFIKSDAILPLNPRVSNLQYDPKHVQLLVLPGTGAASGKLYEDDGRTKGYTQNEYATTQFIKNSQGDRIELTISAREGKYKNMESERKYTIRFAGLLPAKKVSVNGTLYSYASEAKDGAWSYNATDMELIVTIPTAATSSSIKVEIETATSNDMEITNGVKMIVKRMPAIIFDVKAQISQRDWARSPSNNLLRISQIASLIQHKPETAQQEILFLKSNLEPALKELSKEYKVPKSVVDKYIQLLNLK